MGLMKATTRTAARLVTLDVFLIGVGQVTNAEYERFVRTTARRPPGVDDLPAIVRPAQEGYFRELASAYRWHHGEPPAGKADHPVVLVTHEDARAYCHWLADQSGSPFRLPTEAEWEKAARGGREAARYPWGDHIDSTLASFLPHASMKPKMGTTRCVPFRHGYVYGMSGNVWEWVSDWYRSDYYAASDLTTTGPSLALRVRAGAWTNEDVRYLRCASGFPCRRIHLPTASASGGLLHQAVDVIRASSVQNKPMHPGTVLTRDELTRYSRHLSLPEVGETGQRRLKASRVLCVGAGGLGSPAAMYLAAAGVGTLGLVDFDRVDLSNLQRQILHGTPDVGRSKLASARDRLSALNPGVRLELHECTLSSTNAMDILRGYDVVLDGSDNFPTRYLVNDACVLLGILTPTVRFSGSRDRHRCSRPTVGPTAGASIQNRRRPGWPSCAEAGVFGTCCRVWARSSHRDAAAAEPGRAAGRQIAGIRRVADAFHRTEFPERPRLPRVRDPPDGARTGRLRRVLRSGDGP